MYEQVSTTIFKLIFLFLLCHYTKSIKENVILVITDDLGIDFLRPYGYREDAVPMPYIEGLIQNGMLFTNYHSYPSCSPARASLLTGRYGFRTGTRCLIFKYDKNDPNGIHTDEYTIPHALSGMNIKTAALGKWNLQTRYNGQMYNPQIMGFDHYAGNLQSYLDPDYFKWYKTVDEEQYVSHKYGTIDIRDDAIEWLQANQNDQFFLWLAFNAPHFPYHKPPDELHTYHDLEPIDPVEYGLDPLPWYKAMVQSIDTVLQQIFQSLDEDVFKRTNIIFVGDNGDDSHVSYNGYFDPLKVKFTLYEGGIHVPMFIHGPRVANPGTKSSAMVTSVDVFDTVLDMFECQKKRKHDYISDSISFLPVIEGKAIKSDRKFRFSEQGKGLCEAEDYLRVHSGFTIANKKYKLICYNDGREELFDIENDQLENVNLLENKDYFNSMVVDAYDVLKDELLNLLNTEGNEKQYGYYFGSKNHFAIQ